MRLWAYKLTTNNFYLRNIFADFSEEMGQSAATDGAENKKPFHTGITSINKGDIDAFIRYF